MLRYLWEIEGEKRWKKERTWLTKSVYSLSANTGDHRSRRYYLRPGQGRFFMMVNLEGCCEREDNEKVRQPFPLLSDARSFCTLQWAEYAAYERFHGRVGNYVCENKVGTEE